MDRTGLWSLAVATISLFITRGTPGWGGRGHPRFPPKSTIQVLRQRGTTPTHSTIYLYCPVPVGGDIWELSGLSLLMDNPGDLASLLDSSSQVVALTSLYHKFLEQVGGQGSAEGQGEHC